MFPSLSTVVIAECLALLSPPLCPAVEALLRHCLIQMAHSTDPAFSLPGPPVPWAPTDAHCFLHMFLSWQKPPPHAGDLTLPLAAHTRTPHLIYSPAPRIRSHPTPQAHCTYLYFVCLELHPKRAPCASSPCDQHVYGHFPAFLPLTVGHLINLTE